MRSRKIRQAYRIGYRFGAAEGTFTFEEALLTLEDWYHPKIASRIERLACRKGFDKGREARRARHSA